MVAPAPVNPPAEMIAQAAAGLSGDARTTSRFLRTFGFHLLAALLGIALAFM